MGYLTRPIFRCARCGEYHIGLGELLFLWLKSAQLCKKCSEELEKEIDFSSQDYPLEERAILH